MTKAKILIVQNDETGATRLEERLRGLGIYGVRHRFVRAAGCRRSRRQVPRRGPD